MVTMNWFKGRIAELKRTLFKGWSAFQKLLTPTRNAVPFRVITGSAQHIGEREEQQDAYGFYSREEHEWSKWQGSLAVLADGMGGYAMGYEAGQLAVATMRDAYAHQTWENSVSEALEQALHAAGKAVYELARENELEWQVGTTLVAVVIRERELHWISVGDSRIYLYRSGVLVPLTRDHIYANRLYEKVLAGKLTQEEAESHPDRHLLTSYLGIPNVTEIDVSHKPLQLFEGDWILLCSDGLYEDLSEELLEAAVLLAPQEATEYIVQYVMKQQRPYQDNATIVVLACLQ